MKPRLTSADYPAAFFVVVNGGNPNYIDTADSKGGTGFLELVAHIDQTYRTIPIPRVVSAGVFTRPFRRTCIA